MDGLMEELCTKSCVGTVTQSVARGHTLPDDCMSWPRRLLCHSFWVAAFISILD